LIHLIWTKNGFLNDLNLWYYLTGKYLQQNQKENGTGQRGHGGGPVVGQPSRATARECAVGSRGAAQHGPV
jgi:hypothetical protein